MRHGFFAQRERTPPRVLTDLSTNARDFALVQIVDRTKKGEVDVQFAQHSAAAGCKPEAGYSKIFSRMFQ